MRSVAVFAYLAAAGCSGPHAVEEPQPPPSPPASADGEDLGWNDHPLWCCVDIGHVWTAEMQAAADGSNRFAADLFGAMRSQPGNLCFSPFSIHTALAMTADGARGRTLDEMMKVLHLPSGVDSLVAAGDVSRHYAAQHEGPELVSSNRLWGQQGLAWNTGFVKRLQYRHGAGLTPVDFTRADTRATARKTINATVAEQTRGKIPDLLGPGDLSPATRLVLTNAIRFKGAWANSFQAGVTADAPFTRVDGNKTAVPMMAGADTFNYMETPTFQAMELPYEGGGVGMLVLLPRAYDGLPALEQSLTAAKLDEWIKAMSVHSVDVGLPRFRAEGQFQLADTLAELGMPRAFQPGVADFSGMADAARLSLERVVHKSFVDVNEVGTEAAAATGVTAVCSSLPPPAPPFRADRPFLFLIRDTKTGTIFLLGRYAGP